MKKKEKPLNLIIGRNFIWFITYEKRKRRKIHKKKEKLKSKMYTIRTRF